MGISTKIEPIDRDVLFSGFGLSEVERSRALAAFAIEERDRAIAINSRTLGGRVTYETYVDGHEGWREEAVSQDGTIVYEFGLLMPVLDFIGEELVRMSPVLTGRYAKSHVLIADGVEVQSAREAPEAQRFVFLNTTPYARKIEAGLSPQAADGVYQALAAVAQRRFGNSAKIFFGWEGRLIAPAASTRAERKAEQASRVPAIIVRTY